MSTPVLYLIPGAGTDSRLFSPQFERFPAAISPQWLPPKNLREPLADYAKRLAARIDTSRPFVLGGVSLGGMIAQEMALALKPLAVILIASCHTSKTMPRAGRLTGKCMRALPNPVVKGIFRLAAACVDQFGKNLPHKRQYVRMLRIAPPMLVRWQSGAAAEWVLSGALPMPVFHLHGTADPVIPLKNVHPQQVIEKGRHLINITHAERVNDFIAECLKKAEAMQVIDLLHSAQPARAAN